jgi:DNA (cytosine-5)-methyltransferase 1
MASTRKGHEDENVLSQVVACLVSMGYQVSQYIMDAWSYGSKQQRSRIILVIAAPGLTPIVQPKHTHSLHSDDLKNISLGTLLNGEKFGQREHYPTPFPYVPAGAIDDGLPDIANGSVQTCVPFPDHRLTPLPLRNERALIERIPKYPAGSGYKEAFDLNLIPPSLQKSKKETGKAYRRIKKDGLVPTITTSIKLQDSRNGATLHWREDRSISIQEARRTQGYRDDEPIIGTLREQYAIVGNGVDRRVSFAMGLSLRQAVEESHLRGHSLDVSSDELWDLKNAEQRESDNELGEVIHVKAFTRPNQTQKCWNLTRPQSTAFAVRTNKEKAKASATEVSAPDVSANLGVQPATSSQSTALLPDALSNRVRKLSLSPLTSFTSSSTKSSSVVKRSRVEETTGNEVDRDIANAQQPSPRKRARSSSSSRASVSLADTTELRDGASGSGKARFTRHSGLSVEYVPKQWNKKPEMEQREEYQRLRDSQNHHRHG